ncbi:MAG: EAL domain-containing protein [Gammaproteobacteria bacterium]|nr:EAL domain-containing protein [Gammaproteobacteria bacterium]
MERLKWALQNDGFCLARQRIFPLQDDPNDAEHYEFLLRMLDESGDWISPGAFLPAARRHDLSSRLDQWVIDAVLAWLVDHPDELQRQSWCSINLSAQSMGDNRFLEHVIRQFVRSRVPPDKLCFEVAEVIATSHLSGAMVLIRALKQRGCRFALDDFGSGLSAFGELKNLPVDYLKIDGSFVKNIVKDPVARTIVRSIHEIGKVMGKQTIAEHVEDEEVLGQLKNIGVDYAQGYHLGRPENLAKVTAPTVEKQSNLSARG